MTEPQLPLFDQAAHVPASLEEHRVSLLAFGRARGIGEVSLKALCNYFGDVSLAWRASPEELQVPLAKAGHLAPKAIDQIIHERDRLLDTAHRDLDRFRSQGIELLTIYDEGFPKALREVDDPVYWLFVHGNVGLLSQRNLVAVVGTRRPSRAGMKRAEVLTSWLAEQEVAVVSGLAEGIDAVAHQTALDFGVPTVAVLGTGILVVFPASTGHIRRQIVEQGGTVLTEYLPNESYSRKSFVRRNRIQAALSFAVAPIEGDEESGTAHTLRFAEQLHKVIFGVTLGKEDAERGVLKLLRAGGRPIFELDSSDDMRSLRSLLEPALADLPPSSRRPRRFSGLLSEFRRLLATYDLSENELEALLSDMRDEWEKGSGHGSQGGHS